MAENEQKKLGIDIEGIESVAISDASHIKEKGEDLAKEEKTTHDILTGTKAAGALGGAAIIYRSYRKYSNAKKTLNTARVNMIAELSDSLQKNSPEVWQKEFQAEADEIKKLQQEIKNKTEQLSKSKDKAQKSKLRAEIKESNKILSEKSNTFMEKMAKSPEFQKLETLSTSLKTSLENYSTLKGTDPIKACETLASEIKKADAALGKRITELENNYKETINRHLSNLEKNLTPEQQKALTKLREANPNKILSCDEIEKGIKAGDPTFELKKIKEGQSLITAEKGAKTRFINSIDEIAANVDKGKNLANLQKRLNTLNQVIQKNGQVEGAKLLGKDLEKTALSLKASADDINKFEKKAAKYKSNSKIGKYFKAGRLINGAAAVAAVALTVSLIEQDSYDEKAAHAIDKLAEQLNQGVPIKELNSHKYDQNTRKSLIDWALANTTDPKEKEFFEKVKAHDYDYGAYLKDENKIEMFKGGEEEEEGVLTKAWADEFNELLLSNANARLFMEIEKKKNMENSRTSEPNSIEGGENPGDEPQIEGSPEPVPDHPKEPEDKSELDQLKEKRDELLAGRKPEDLPEEDRAKLAEIDARIAGLSQDTGINPGKVQDQGQGQDRPQDQDKTKPTKTPSVRSPARKNIPTGSYPNIPASTAGMAASGAEILPTEKGKKIDTTNLPPEAIVQQPEEESFWTWKNILWIGLAVATLGVGVYFILKYKKKADKAKKETSSLQSTVNDLQTQVDSLKSNTDVTTKTSTNDGSALASAATNITNTDTLNSINNLLSNNNNSRV